MNVIASTTLTARISELLRQTPPEQWPAVGQLAKMMSTTESSMRRRLEAEGRTYSQIKRDVRRERAVRHLRAGEKTNEAIAAELGFSDQSSFFRAFRQWTGARPTDFRPGGKRAVDRDTLA